MYLSQQDSTELEEKYYCPCKDAHASHIFLHSFYVIASTVGYVNFRLVLAKGIWILPLHRLNPVLLQLLTFDTPWRGFRVESEALCAPGKLVEQVFRQLDIFRNWFHDPNPLLFGCSVVSNSLWTMDCSTPGFPALHHFWEFAQTHIHRVGDAIQSSHPLLSPSPPACISILYVF